MMKLMEVAKVQSEDSVLPSPPVMIPQTLPLPSMTTEPESPQAEKRPDFEFRGITAISLDIVPGLPSK